jgi:hypothetical protein
MCPVCLATAALIAGSATGSGGITALVAGTILKRRSHIRFPEQTNAKEVKGGDDNGSSESAESGLAR